jgi:hypothetical protein
LPTGDAVSRAIFEKITDGTNTAAVKAASTAAVATDPALVVAVSPNNTVAVSAASLPLPTGAATAANQTTLGNQTTKLNDGTNTAAVKAANTAATAADPALVVALSPNTGAASALAVIDLATKDVFGQTVIVQRLPQIQVSFFLAAPSALLTVTTSGGASSAQGLGTGVFSTGTATTASLSAVSINTVNYTPHCEIYAALTAAFTTPTSAASKQRLGLYNATDGFSFGYNGTTFGLWLRYNTVDTFISQATWNVDPLAGSASSKFTRAGTPEALIPTDINLYRVRFGWLGIAPIVFEILSPDGNFVVVHSHRFPNSVNTVSITNPNLPLTLEVSKTASDATNLSVTCGCWVAGVSSSTSSSFLGLGSIAAVGQSVGIPCAGMGSLGISLTGTWTGAIAFQSSVDGMVWNTDSVLDKAGGRFISFTTTNSTYDVALGGSRLYRVIAIGWTIGTATVTYHGGNNPSIVTSNSLITDGLNNGPVAVKTSDTPPVNTDAALVVSMSPNSVSDEEITDLLRSILTEMRKTNIHLSILSDNIVKDEDVE